MTETPAPPPPEPTPVDDGVQSEATGISQWEFIERIPTREDVVRLLETLPPVWGIATVDFADFVQALPQSKKTKQPQVRTSDSGEEKTFMVDVYVEAFTLYVSVAGRIKMLQAAAELNDWSVEFEPEPVTPTEVPGYLMMAERLVYREYVVITAMSPDPVFSLGRKPGTAWVPASGGRAAAGSNPYEKVETSARGRAIAAWGFGVLPGSGVASVEEMQGVGQNRAHLDAEAATGRGGGSRASGGRKSRGDLMQEALALSEELRQIRGIDEFDMRGRIGKYLIETLGVVDAYDSGKGEIDWTKVKDGQLQLLVNSQRDSLQKIKDEGSAV